MVDLSQLGSDRIRPLRRVEYDRLVDLGVFDDERIELLRGFLVVMSPQGSLHSESVSRLGRLLNRALDDDRGVVRVQCPFAASDDSEPEPDITVVPPGDYWTGHPAHALLLIEVSCTSIEKDRVMKAAVYAEAGVPEYWVVNLPDRCVHVFREPAPGGYRRSERVEAGGVVRPEAFPDIALEVADFLPPA